MQSHENSLGFNVNNVENKIEIKFTQNYIALLSHFDTIQHK